MARAISYKLIYSPSRARARRSAWLITVPASLSASGKRQQKAYGTEKEARAALRELREAHKRLGEGVKDCTLDLEAQAIWKRDRGMAEKAGTTTTAAISFAVECIEAFGSLDEARRLARWAKNNAMRAWPDVTVLEALDQHLAEATHLADATMRQRKAMRARLCREALDFMANVYMHELNPQLVQAEFARLAWPPQTENTALRMLKALCSWAQRKGYIDPHVDPLKHLQLQRVAEKEIHALQPHQLADLLRTAMQEPRFTQCGLAVALGAFAGIRPTECLRLRWADISEEDGVISVRGKASKTGGTRHVHLRPVLREWLDHFAPPDSRDPDALVLSHYPLTTVTQFHTAAGLREWPADVLRHSFASYSIKAGTPMHEVQADMGHATLQLLRSRYLNMRGLTAAGAREWWNMTPTRVVSFHGYHGLP